MNTMKLGDTFLIFLGVLIVGIGMIDILYFEDKLG